MAKHKAELREVNQQKQDELRRQREELNAQVPALCFQLKCPKGDFALYSTTL